MLGSLERRCLTQLLYLYGQSGGPGRCHSAAKIRRDIGHASLIGLRSTLTRLANRGLIERLDKNGRAPMYRVRPEEALAALAEPVVAVAPLPALGPRFRLSPLAARSAR
jgi:hypothetical protein